MSEGHIFLSYRSIEADFALKLAADLKNAGVNLWMDRPDGIRGGHDWPRQIEDALSPRRCALMIAVLSPEYLKAEYCRIELARAKRWRIPILPVLLHPIPDIPLEVERLQFIRFCDFDNEDRLVRTWHEDTLYAERFGQLIAVIPDAQKGKVPDAKTQYLTSLIAELESRKGVLEYVELSAQADAPKAAEATRPEPSREDEWAAGFSMLIDKKSDSVGSGRALSAPTGTPTEKLTFNTITEAVARFPRFVLIGEPGAGKTTTIRRLALEAARQRLENPRTAPLPVLLYLPRWGDEPTPLDFVRKHWPFAHDLAGLLAQGDVLLYLDGLNEMGAAGVEKAKKLTEWFDGQNAPQRVIVTCRAGDYAGELKLGGTPTVLAEEMDETQTWKFMERYLGGKAAGFLERVMPEDKQSKNDTRSLFHLARNPYLLGALAFLYQNSPDRDLPKNNGALFCRLARSLWWRERVKKTPGWKGYKVAATAFGRLAFAMIDENKPIDVPIEYAIQHLGDESLLRVGQSANLIEIHGEEVRFYHQLMQEYFCAIELEKRGVYLKVAKPRFDYFQVEQIADKWHQVIIALTGITRQPDITLKYVLSKNLYLAGFCIASGSKVTDDLKTEIIIRLTKVLLSHGTFVFQIFRWASTILRKKELLSEDAFDNLLSNRLGNLIDDFLLSQSGNAERKTASDILRQIARSDSVPSLLSGLEDNHFPIREAVAEVLGKIGDPRAIPALINALHDQNRLMLYAASHALGEIGEIALPELVQALNHKDRNVRFGAAIALEDIGDASTISSLMKRLGDPDSDVRYVIVSALGKTKQPEIIPTLVNLLHDLDVGFAAATAIVEFANPIAISGLLEVLRNDKHDWLREKAANTLGEIGDLSTAPSLIEALGDADWDVRQAALKALRKMGEALVPSLIAGLQHENQYVRWKVTEILAEIGKPIAIPGLLVALSDEYRHVHNTASEALENHPAYEIVPGLLMILDENKPGRYEAARLLAKIADPSAVSSLEKSLYLNYEYPLMREAILNALKNINTLEAVDAIEKWYRGLREQLISENIQTRRKTAKILGEINDGRFVAALLRALRDEDEDVRQNTAGSLGRISYFHLDSILEALAHDETWIRWAAAYTLAQVADPKSVNELARRLSDTVQPVWWAYNRVCDIAAEALTRIGTPEALAAVEQWRAEQADKGRE